MTRADSAGGCDFAIASNLTARDTTVFWAPEVNARVVLLTAAPPALPGAALAPICLRTDFARRASDGLYIAHRHGRTAAYSLLLGEAEIDGPIMALVPLDAFAPERLSASERLWRTAFGLPAADIQLTRQRRRRLCQMLRAADAKTVDASHREIAEALFGRRRVEAELWHASSLRFATMRLVRDGQAMIGDRRDIIRTMHRAQAPGPERAATDYVIEGMPETPVLGRLVERGLHDDHQGTAYAIIDGIDGRLHHLRFLDIDATGDTTPGGIVETRVWTPKEGGAPRLALIGRSDLTLAEQIVAEGATWLDRVQLARGQPALSEAGFGAEVRNALVERADHLVSHGLARRQGPRIRFARNLFATLRSREIESIADRLVAQTRRENYQPVEGEPFSGRYRQRLLLASGRFALIDTSHGFALVPWTPALDRHFGENLSGRLTPDGSVDWSIGRKRGPSR